jgi:CO/xanthine dehydrogenase Mo-binding subunit
MIRFLQPNARHALFASSQFAFGMARMYEALGSGAANFAVFRTMEEACQRLGLEPSVLRTV